MSTYAELLAELREKKATIAGLRRERDEALNQSAANWYKYLDARAKALEEAAALLDGLILAGDYSIMKAHILSNAKAAILALKDKPNE